MELVVAETLQRAVAAADVGVCQQCCWRGATMMNVHTPADGRTPH